MDIFKIAGLGLAAAIMAVFIKNWRAEIAIQIALVASIIIFLSMLPYVKGLVDMFYDISERIGLDSAYIGVILKVIGIAFVSQFGAELCRDAGQSAIASKIEFGGKVIIVTLSMPILYNFLGVVEQIIKLV